MSEFLLYILLGCSLGLIGTGMLILGLVRKKSSIWGTGIVLGMVGGALLLLAALTGVSKTVEKGTELLGDLKESVESGELSEDVGRELGAQFGEFISGFSQGVNNTLVEEEIYPSNVLRNKGLKFETAETYSGENWNDNRVVVYVIFEKDYQGTLEMKMFNAEGAEIGRTWREVTQEAGGAKWLEFSFDKYSDLDPGGYCTIEEKK